MLETGMLMTLSGFVVMVLSAIGDEEDTDNIRRLFYRVAFDMCLIGLIVVATAILREAMRIR